MKSELIQKLNALRENRNACLVVTDTQSGESELIKEPDITSTLYGGTALKVIQTGKSGMHEIEGRSLFFNAHVPAPRLMVIGAVHISQALIGLAATAGYDLEIVDPRSAFATQARFNGVKLHADWPQDVLNDENVDAYTALAAVTHDPKIDDFPLKLALERGCFYVGALGSRKTHAGRVQRLKNEGVSETDLARIQAPIGLDIGASSPGEIAISVMAEVISAFRRRGAAEIGVPPKTAV